MCIYLSKIICYFRGFQAVSYVMAGEDIHEDFNGHKGIINEGGHMW